MDFTDWITDDVKKVLLLEPNFPIPNKSRNHSDFLPIGLLKKPIVQMRIFISI